MQVKNRPFSSNECQFSYLIENLGIAFKNKSLQKKAIHKHDKEIIEAPICYWSEWN